MLGTILATMIIAVHNSGHNVLAIPIDPNHRAGHDPGDHLVCYRSST